MKRFGKVPGSDGEFGSFRIVTDPISISRTLLAALCDRLEARSEGVGIPRDEKTFDDAVLVDKARHVLSHRK